jgi:hypothetical protein
LKLWKMPVNKRRKGKQGKQPAPTKAIGESPTFETAKRIHSVSTDQSKGPTHDLILTSEKRRGIFECDYCHADISQLPRIRCAVCVDFDLCLDCFTSTDHATAIARLKAASDQNGMAALSAIQHEATHGYRVCDSTRYPLFSTARTRVNRLNTDVEKNSGMSNEEQRVSDINVASSGIDEIGDEMDVDEAALGSNEEIMEREQDANSMDVTELERTAVNDGVLTEELNSTDKYIVYDDPKFFWTVEEDLRLLEGIQTNGLGNWVEIAEAVAGQGSIGKTPRRCMERYFDDFLGRYGHILPSHTLQAEGEDEVEESDATKYSVEEFDKGDTDDTPSRTSKRRAVMMRSPSSMSTMAFTSRKKYKAIPTETLEGYGEFWANPYLPPIEGVRTGQEVGRDHAYKAEQLFVKMSMAMDSIEQVKNLHKEWTETRLLKPGGPTVLPPRPDDVVGMTGAELSGFMPRREDFDVEWENDAEQAVADMEFLPGEPIEDKQLKLQVLAIYNSKLDEREKRKKFVLSRKLYDYRKTQTEHEKLPQDERDLVHRMRLFERFHTPEEHKEFLADLLKAKRLRKEIAKLQMYRRLGIRTLLEAEKYELDKERRQFHKTAHTQKNTDVSTPDENTAATSAEVSGRSGMSQSVGTVSSSYWKQYRTGDRRERKSINRGVPWADSQETSNNLKNNSADGSSKVVDTRRDDGDMDAVQPVEDTIAIQAKLEVSSRATKEDDFAHLPGYNLLSSREVLLCQRTRLTPEQYLEVKNVLIQESLLKGLLDREGPGSSKRALVRIDVERRGDVIDFLVRAGWVSTKVGNLARNLPTSIGVLSKEPT